MTSPRAKTPWTRGLARNPPHTLLLNDHRLNCTYGITFARTREVSTHVVDLEGAQDLQRQYRLSLISWILGLVRARLSPKMVHPSLQQRPVLQSAPPSAPQPTTHTRERLLERQMARRIPQTVHRGKPILQHFVRLAWVLMVFGACKSFATTTRRLQKGA